MLMKKPMTFTKLITLLFVLAVFAACKSSYGLDEFSISNNGSSLGGNFFVWHDDFYYTDADVKNETERIEEAEKDEVIAMEIEESPLMTSYTSQVSYNIAFVRSIDALPNAVYRFDYPLIFDIVQVYGMNNEEVEQKINNSIMEATTWMVEVLYYRHWVFEPKVFMQSERFISFGYGIQLYHPLHSRDFLNYFVTIDVQTGERVMLGDLIKINSDISETILEVSDFWWTDEIPPFVPSEMLERLKISSLTARGLYDTEIHQGLRSIYETLGPLLFRSSFYLKENVLVIVFLSSVSMPGELISIYINLDDIEDFLKVEKW